MDSSLRWARWNGEAVAVQALLKEGVAVREIARRYQRSHVGLLKFIKRRGLVNPRAKTPTESTETRTSSALLVQAAYVLGLYANDHARALGSPCECSHCMLGRATIAGLLVLPQNPPKL